MDKKLKNIRIFVEKNSYLEFEESYDNVISFCTRENGDSYDETPGSEDINEAIRMQKLVVEKFSNTSADVEDVDEWVYLNVIYKS